MHVAELAQNMSFGRQMASNTPSSFRIELGDVDDLQDDSPVRTVSAKGASRVASTAAAAYRSTAPAANAANAELSPASLPPFAALAARQGRPLRVAILSDFTRIPYANG